MRHMLGCICMCVCVCVEREWEWETLSFQRERERPHWREAHVVLVQAPRGLVLREKLAYWRGQGWGVVFILAYSSQSLTHTSQLRSCSSSAIYMKERCKLQNTGVNTPQGWLMSFIWSTKYNYTLKYTNHICAILLPFKERWRWKIILNC